MEVLLKNIQVLSIGLSNVIGRSSRVTQEEMLGVLLIIYLILLITIITPINASSGEIVFDFGRTYFYDGAVRATSFTMAKQYMRPSTYVIQEYDPRTASDCRYFRVYL